MLNIGKQFHPNTLEEAQALLTEHSDAIIIAGGTDILIKVREGHMPEQKLVSIRNIKELKEIKMVGEDLYIGSMASFTNVERNPHVMELAPILVKAMSQVAGPQIRNLGTIGGNISNGITSAESGSTLMSLNADLEIFSKGERKIVPITEFYLGHAKTILEQGDVLTNIILRKKLVDGFVGDYYKYAPRNAMDIALTGVAVTTKLSADKKTLEGVTFAFGASAPVPIRAFETEKALIGKPLSKEMINTIESMIPTEVSPRTSWKGTAEFRTHIATTLSARLFEETIQKAGGKL